MGQQAPISYSAPSEKSAGILKMRPGQLHIDEGSAARFFYCARATNADRGAGLDACKKSAAGMLSSTSGQQMTRRDEGDQVAPKGEHPPTLKPTDLTRCLCRLVTPTGGVVLDPFIGSGSTGKAAVLEASSSPVLSWTRTMPGSLRQATALRNLDCR